ncbi:MAG: hypothetical protein LBH98_05330 [Chitinispirillales bacterium]|jgi:hypothetical protein|nr:hypothetical protein [Chitinispirillales bacterium]
MRVLKKRLVFELMVLTMVFVAGCGGGADDDNNGGGNNNGKHSNLSNKTVTWENLDEFWNMVVQASDLYASAPNAIITHSANETITTYSGKSGKYVTRVSYTLNGTKYNSEEFSQKLSEFRQQYIGNRFSHEYTMNMSIDSDDFSQNERLFADISSIRIFKTTNELEENGRVYSAITDYTSNETLDYSGEFKASIVFDNLKISPWGGTFNNYVSGKVFIKSGGNTFDITEWYLAKNRM